MTMPTSDELQAFYEATPGSLPEALGAVRDLILDALIAEAETNPAALSYLVEVDESSIESVSSGNDVADWLRSMKDRLR